MRFAPDYVKYVLNENFEDAKALFFRPLVAIHYSHLVMLAAERIISGEDARALGTALGVVAQIDLRNVEYDATAEDLFFYIERQLTAICGEEVAGRLHTARSRNDIDMTMYRMTGRQFILGLVAATLDLRGALLDLAESHRHTVFAVHTHTQRAQPTTVAHYLLAVIEQLERDAERLKPAYGRTNRSPLGACAITGTGFPIDRRLTADLLGFSGPTGNTYGSIAAVDYMLEAASAAGVLLVGVGRFVQDLLLWSTAEFDYVRLGDGFVQCSSIMPQKRNPVALEHVRALGSKALGQMQAIGNAVHNTPFGDVVDTEDDLQPLVATAFRDATRAVKLLAAALRSVTFDVEGLEARAAAGWSTLTELADTLVRDHGVPFRTAHAIAGRVAAVGGQDAGRSLSAIMGEVSMELLGRPLEYSDAALAEILNARHFVEVRRTSGGPAPEQTEQAVRSSRAALAADEQWTTAAAAALQDAERRLAERVARL